MLTGIILVIAGLLIAIYPPLLSLIVAALLVALGVMVLLMAYYHRKLGRREENPVVDVIFRM